ncbi:cuticle protein 19.8-like [Lepeophtheirus salmonis]|uniref:cuticle protein 19.8-like n=1 Tax=Lepeophtheirus salmonis TaxID=72036 RepID=UPI001AEB1A0D|nr:cuticle protein 21-like [Lepeophtheirus salmonis]
MVSKAVLLFLVFGSALAAPQYQQSSYSSSASSDPYAYQYAVQDGPSGNDFSAEESSDGQVVSGSYKVVLPDGRIQVVTYRVEGESGFVADVKYEGTPTYPTAPQPKYV